MPYFPWGVGAFGWAWMSFMMLFWVAVLVVLVVAGFRLVSRREANSPLDLLKQRYARGEITREQFEQDRKLLAS